MKKVLVIGSTVADIVINIDKLPTTMQDVHVHSQTFSLGGCACNVSSMIRNFGVPCLLFSPVGTGIYADFVRKELAARGLSSPIPPVDMENGCCFCFVEESGERTFICHHGAEYFFCDEWFESLDTTQFEYVYVCGLEIEETTGDTVLGFLERSGLKIVFGPGPRIDKIPADKMKRLFALHPIVHLNEDEVCRFTGCDNIESAAAALYGQTGNTVIITNGANGSYFYDQTGLHHVQGVKAEKIVDTIGAGDGHCGAVLACLAAGRGMQEALALANAAAARIVATKGATISAQEFALAKPNDN